MTPLTDTQHAEIEAVVDAAAKIGADIVPETARVLLAENRRLRAALTAIRHLHKDSPMGPCPVCIDADDAAAGGDGLIPYPCPTGRIAGAQDCDPPSVRAAADEPRETVHGCPPDGSGITPCCGRTPFELPRTDRMVTDRALVTCTGGAPMSG